MPLSGNTIILSHGLHKDLEICMRAIQVIQAEDGVNFGTKVQKHFESLKMKLAKAPRHEEMSAEKIVSINHGNYPPSVRLSIGSGRKHVPTISRDTIELTHGVAQIEAIDKLIWNLQRITDPEFARDSIRAVLAFAEYHRSHSQNDLVLYEPQNTDVNFTRAPEVAALLIDMLGKDNNRAELETLAHQLEAAHKGWVRRIATRALEGAVQMGRDMEPRAR